MEIREEVLKRKDQLVNDLCGWIKAKGVYEEESVGENQPFGAQVKSSLDYIYDLAKKDGFKVSNCDGYCVEIIYGNDEENVTVLAHADVVPEGDNWIHKPFGGDIENNLIFGRGALDDKGPGIAAYYALKIIKDNNIPVKRKIRIVFGGNEERGSKCLEYYFHTLKKEAPTYGFTPDADFPLIYGEKGILTYKYYGEYNDNVIEYINAGTASNAVPAVANFILNEEYKFEKIKEFEEEYKVKIKVEYKNNKTYLEFVGLAAHAAEPHLGINALSYGLLFLSLYTESKLAQHFAPKFKDYYGEGLEINTESEEFKYLTMNLGLGSYQDNNYSFTINIRYPNNVTGSALKEKLDKSIMNEGKLLSDSEPLYIDPNSKFVQTLLNIYKEVTNDKDAQPLTIGGGTYARETINTIAFGMDFKRNNGSGRIHSPEEAINIDDLVDGCEIYTKALIELGNM